MTHIQFTHAGLYLFGNVPWHRSMAALLGIDDRAVRRYANGSVQPIPAPIVARVVGALRQRAFDLQDLLVHFPEP